MMVLDVAIQRSKSPSPMLCMFKASHVHCGVPGRETGERRPRVKCKNGAYDQGHGLVRPTSTVLPRPQLSWFDVQGISFSGTDRADPQEWIDALQLEHLNLALKMCILV